MLLQKISTRLQTSPKQGLSLVKDWIISTTTKTKRDGFYPDTGERGSNGVMSRHTPTGETRQTPVHTTRFSRVSVPALNPLPTQEQTLGSAKKKARNDLRYNNRKDKSASTHLEHAQVQNQKHAESVCGQLLTVLINTPSPSRYRCTRFGSLRRNSRVRQNRAVPVKRRGAPRCLDGPASLAVMLQVRVDTFIKNKQKRDRTPRSHSP